MTDPIAASEIAEVVRYRESCGQARENGYDWVWQGDADAALTAALTRLAEVERAFDRSVRDCFAAQMPVDTSTEDFEAEVARRKAVYLTPLAAHPTEAEPKEKPCS